jgi:glycosyltransferase involved in cell wall biosynthesis
MSTLAKRIVVCAAQVPFVRGGAESLVEELVRALREHGHEAELVAVPFKWYPREEILAHAAAWRLLDLSESNGRTIDVAIGTKFPSYFVRHPNKVAWLMHQYRAAYDLCGTVYSDFAHVEQDVNLRQRLIELDREMIGECRRAFAISRTTARRLADFNGVEIEALYHPPRLAPRLREGPCGEYVLSVGRLDATKRVDLAIKALACSGASLRLVVVGEGNERAALERAVAEANVDDRVHFAGVVDDEALVELYAGALATVFVPYDEDLGYVTLESFLAGKPVVTTRDSGGPLEFVEHDVNGLVCEPSPEAIGAALSQLGAALRRARDLGHAGLQRARTITWDGVVDQLVGGRP